MTPTQKKKESLADVERERQQLIRERDEYEEKTKTPKQRAVDARNLSILERLSRRGRTETRTITLKDDLGALKVPVRTPSMRAITEFDAIQKKMAGGFKEDTVESFADLEDRLCHILGEEICADPGMGYDYWKNGDYAPILPFELFAAAMDGYHKDLKDGKSFLGNAKRPPARGTVHKDGPKTE